MSKVNKILVLARHAHRDTTHKKEDNGLSNSGQKQAIRLKNDLGARLSDDEPLFLSSPKRRCIETLEPLAAEFGKRVKVDPLLDENSAEESTAQFIDRIKTFIDWWKEKAPPVTLACSHGDWLPEAVRLLTGKETDFIKGSWALLTLKSGKIKLEESSANRNH